MTDVSNLPALWWLLQVNSIESLRDLSNSRHTPYGMDSDDDYNSDDGLDESDFDGLNTSAGSIFATGVRK